SLSITRERTTDLDATIALLREVLELSDEDIEQLRRRLQQARRPFEAVPVMFGLTEVLIARIAVNQFRLPGIDVQASFVRYYPQAEHFSHSVNYVAPFNEREQELIDPVAYAGTHYIGKTGVERFYE